MKKNSIKALIFIFAFSFLPANFSNAITQGQISAEVQIVCPDNYGNWYSGSGTIIDSKGIILTNKHVVTDEKGSIINTCYIGFTELINDEPNFGSQSNPNLAEVKYYTNTEDMDAAILYLNNPSNKNYPYISIWESDSSNLKLGDGIEVIGYPSIGGSTLTYVNGVMSGFSGNYIKTTAPLEHGNSGGSAYTYDGKFIGIPTKVVKGELNSISFILDINKIKSWLSGLLGNDYTQSINNYKPTIENKTVVLSDDVTPPDGSGVNASVCADYKCEAHLNFENSWDVNWPYFNWDGFKDASGINGYYVYFGKNFNASPVSEGVYTKNNYSGPGFTLEEPGIYYLVIQAKDKNGNVSSPIYWTYYYKTPDNIGTLDYGESDTAKILSNRPTKIYIYSFDNGYKGDLLEVVYFNSSQIQRYNLPTNNIYIEWESTKKKGFIVEELAEFEEDGSYREGHWHYACDKQYYYSNKSEWINCMRESNKKELYSWGDNYLTVTGLPVGKKYDFNLSGFYNKNNQLTQAYFHNILELTPTKSNQFKKSNFVEKLKGKILLQVESNGEAWYINPDNQKRYYLGRPEEAFNIMRELGLGISNKDFDLFNGKAPARLSGKIVIKVEDVGKAYYVNPSDLKMHYLGRPADAFNVMRSLGLGISNNDIEKIEKN